MNAEERSLAPTPKETTMEATTKQHHPVAKRVNAVTPEKVPPELTMQDKAELLPSVAALVERDETRVEGFSRESSQIKLSKGARWIALFSADGERCVAAALVAPAEASTFAATSRLSEVHLRHSLAIERMHVDPSYQGVALLPALAYLTLRRGRLLERLHVVGYVSDAEAPLCGLLDLKPLSQLSPTRKGELVPVCQRLDIAVHRAYTSAGPRGQAVLRNHFVDEAVETLDGLIARLFSTPWFASVHDGTLTREQYVYSLSNMHQFVRWTTRLIGRAVSLSDDPQLRSHFLMHLNGEINHEVVIENDLGALGADVDYVVNAMVPNIHTQEFMVVQESMIGFHEDPVLFMAAPFAAEGFAARLDQRFVDGLSRCARSWGIANPKKVTAFIASHIHFDGGDDGHWAMTRDILETHLENDMRLQQFLNAVRLSMNGFIHSYASYVDTLGIWSAIPAS
jgi:hypothetical protein